jgi:hypothetical protein
MSKKDLVKQFVPYELAVRLKNIGFTKEFCVAYYLELVNPIEGKLHIEVCQADDYMGCAAPLIQQAIGWFRKNHNFVIQYNPKEIENEDGYCDLYHNFKISEYDGWRGGRRNTTETAISDNYEEAELILVERLIQLVEEKID